MIKNTRSKNRLIVVVLFVAFLLPVVAAWLFMNVESLRPMATKNHGQLIHPVVSLDFDVLVPVEGAMDITSFAGKWNILQRIPGSCDEPCQAALAKSRQARLALGHRRDRVQRIVVLTQQSIDGYPGLLSEHPDLLWVLDSESDQFARQFVGLGEDEIAIVDPFGYWMMAYQSTHSASDILRDFERLLKVSHREYETLEAIAREKKTDE